MDGTLRDGVVRVGGDARQRFYDSQGYGRPLDGDAVEFAPVEAAHLLYRDDLDAVVAGDERLGFRRFFERMDLGLRFVVYKDLRDRGFYLSPVRAGEGAGDAVGDGSAGCGGDGGSAGGAEATRDAGDDAVTDFHVYPRGKGPWDDEVAYRVRVIGERRSVPAASLDGHVLAVVDEDGDLTYFETEWTEVEGSAVDDPPGLIEGVLLGDRVTVWEPPAGLYEDGFYGQRLAGRDADAGPLQLSLVEAAHLAREGVLGFADDVDADDVVAAGRDVEGERFERRLAVYRALRTAGVVPKSGFKFGADFRTYESFEGVASMDHSESLVRVVTPDHAFVPRDLSLDVRLAGGVRKRMVFALTAANGEVDWLAVGRLTP